MRNLADGVRYFFQAIRVPKSVRAKGPNAVRHYHSLEVPEHLVGARRATRVYRMAKTLIDISGVGRRHCNTYIGPVTRGRKG